MHAATVRRSIPSTPATAMLPHEVVQEGHEPVMVQLLLVSFASHGLLVRFHRQRLLCNMYHLCTRLPIFPVYDMYISARAHAPTRRNRPLTKSVRYFRPVGGEYALYQL